LRRRAPRWAALLAGESFGFACGVGPRSLRVNPSDSLAASRGPYGPRSLRANPADSLAASRVPLGRAPWSVRCRADHGVCCRIGPFSIEFGGQCVRQWMGGVSQATSDGLCIASTARPDHEWCDPRAPLVLCDFVQLSEEAPGIALGAVELPIEIQLLRIGIYAPVEADDHVPGIRSIESIGGCSTALVLAIVMGSFSHMSIAS